MGIYFAKFKPTTAGFTSARSILTQMVGAFLILLILPVTVIGYISTATASENIMSQMKNSISTSTYQTSNCFDLFLERAENTSMQVYTDSALQNYSLHLNDDTKFALKNEASNSLTQINSSSEDMELMILFNTGEVLGKLASPSDMIMVTGSDWYKQVMESDGKAVWVDFSDSIQLMSNSALTMVKAFKLVSGEKAGIIIVNVKPETVRDLLAAVKLGEGDNTYLLTPYGKVLSADSGTENSNLEDRQFIKDVEAKIQSSNSGVFSSSDNGTECLVSYCRSEKTGMTVITTVPEAYISKAPSSIVKATLFAGILFTVLATVSGYVFSLRMTKAMRAIADVMARAENGDLTASLSMKRKDEIGMLVSSFDRMIANLRDLVGQSRDATVKVASSAESMSAISADSARVSSDVASAISEVASGAASQATDVENSVQNVKQLTERIERATETMVKMQDDSETMKKLSESGIDAISDLNNKTAQTNKITSEVVDKINELNMYVKNIDKITNILRTIAEKTNLLSLNAAIESARAGESGKGFAVVADEIRKLAEQSNKHTKDIQIQLDTIYKQARSTSEMAGMAENIIMEQSEKVTQTTKLFMKINEMTSRMTDNIIKSGDMIKEMNTFKEKVLSNMENISAVSEEVSASTQEVSASTEEQLASIEELDNMAVQIKKSADDLIDRMNKFII